MTENGDSPDLPSTLKFCVVDVETSGLRTDRHRILQVGAVVVSADGTVLNQWSSLVRPRHRWLFRVGPQHIHQLRRRELRVAPQLATVMARLAEFLRDATFTAHNADFDAGFIVKAASEVTVPLDISRRLCTLRLSRLLDPDRQLSHRLADVCARYQVSLDRPHDALEDALATAAVLPYLLRAHNVSSADQLFALTDTPSPTAQV